MSLGPYLEGAWRCGKGWAWQPRKAKSRIVVLGYQDPNIEDIPRDSPTLHKETRSLLLQLCASRAWVIRSFDVKTAFLRGSKRDTRTLGIEPLPEMRDRMKLRSNEICELLKSAYGLVNAPYLWYEELKESLCGFRISSFVPWTHACLFYQILNRGSMAR